MQPTLVGHCDDGNVISYDGCSDHCDVEDGWYCYGGDPYNPDHCFEICGDKYDMLQF